MPETPETQNKIKKTPALSSWLYLASLQYFAVQFITALAWANPYSWRQNAISDLGNTQCGRYGERYVCSPLHSLMNVSFAVLGCTMLVGSVMRIKNVNYSNTSKAGYSLLAIAGAGTILVGAFPENTVAQMHVLGAAFPFLFGNVALILIGSQPEFSKPYRLYTQFSGVVALLALAVLLSKQSPGNFGAIERVVAYPQTIWLSITGAVALLAQPRRA